MGESKPAFVIHGVNVRGESDFKNQVIELNKQVGDNWRFVPIYWGDLGASDFGTTATIPRATKGLEAAALLNTAASGVRADVAEIAAAAAAAVIVETAVALRTDDTIHDEVEQEWRRTEWLRLIEDPTLAEEIGTAIGEIISTTDDGTGGAVRAGDTRGIADGVVRAFDRVVGSIVVRILAKLNAAFRTNFGPTIARFLGDVFVFEKDRDRIQLRLTNAMQREGVGTAERPATVLAHSLGGVIAFSTAVRKSNAIHLDRFITFGSQSAFFHVIREIGEVPKFENIPVVLPARIGQWLNIWEPLDPLAFLAAGVFRLSSGDAPIDRELPHIPAHTLWTHSSYWADPIFAKWIRDFLS